MINRYSVKKGFDFYRLSKAVSRPGIDPRVWIGLARIDDDDDGTNWDLTLGYLTDVEPYTSGFNQDNETVCRAAVINGEYIPPKLTQETVILVPEGNVNSCPVIIGKLHNEDEPAPVMINGLPVAGLSIVSTPAAVSPFDTELKVSEHNRREQYAGEFYLQSKQYVNYSPKCVLGADPVFYPLGLGNEEPVPLGESLLDVIIEFNDALLNTLATSPQPPTGLPNLVAQWEAIKLTIYDTTLSKKTFTE